MEQVAGSQTPATATQVWAALEQLHSRVHRHLSEQMGADFGLGLASGEALRILAAAPMGRLRMSDLAAALSMTISGVSRLVDQMEVALLVERVRCPSDGRVTYVHLTDLGWQQHGAVGSAMDEVIAELLSKEFESEELAELLRLLT